MIKYILLFLFIPTLCFGEVNEKYSYKDFMNMSFTKVDVKEFNDSTIVGSNFYQENKPDEDIFPDGLKGVIFHRCNLDNVKIKDGMTVKSSTNRKIKVQNDLEDWKVEKVLGKWEAVEPVDKKRFIELKISVDAKDIPESKLTESITEAKSEKAISNIAK